MSSTVRGYGYVAKLRVPLKDDGPGSREEVQDALWAAKSGLGINYEGTLLFIDFNEEQSLRHREADVLHLFLGDDGNQRALLQGAIKHGLEIVTDTIVPFSCVWYTGVDNPMNTLKLKDFMQKVPPTPATFREVGTAAKMPGTPAFTMAVFHGEQVPENTVLYTR